MKILVKGDLHGNWRALRGAVDLAVHEGCEYIIQVGDFGIWPGDKGVEFLDISNAILERAGVTLLFVDGNHEDFNQIDDLHATTEPNEFGHYQFRSHIHHIPRGCVWEMDGKTFLGLGGAASIDKHARVPHLSWWPQEMITQSDVLKMVDNCEGKQIDYMFTHDCSDQTDWGFALIPDHSSMMNRRVIDWSLGHVKPRMQFHGHMHKFFDWSLKHDDGAVTKVYGLNLEAERYSSGILDTDTDKFRIIHG